MAVSQRPRKKRWDRKVQSRAKFKKWKKQQEWKLNFKWT